MRLFLLRHPLWSDSVERSRYRGCYLRRLSGGSDGAGFRDLVLRPRAGRWAGRGRCPGRRDWILRAGFPASGRRGLSGWAGLPAAAAAARGSESVTEPDGETVHNAFFDRRFEP